MMLVHTTHRWLQTHSVQRPFSRLAHRLDRAAHSFPLNQEVQHTTCREDDQCCVISINPFPSASLKSFKREKKTDCGEERMPESVGFPLLQNSMPFSPKVGEAIGRLEELKRVSCKRASLHEHIPHPLLLGVSSLRKKKNPIPEPSWSDEPGADLPSCFFPGTPD